MSVKDFLGIKQKYKVKSPRDKDLFHFKNLENNEILKNTAWEGFESAPVASVGAPKEQILNDLIVCVPLLLPTNNEAKIIRNVRIFFFVLVLVFSFYLIYYFWCVFFCFIFFLID